MQQGREQRTRAPITARLGAGFAGFFRTEAAGAVVLLAATIVALVIVNSPLNPAYQAFWNIETGIFFGAMEFGRSLLHWVDDALMALFFFVVGLEIKRELLVGELSDVRRAALPVLAAIGGMVVPALLYVAVNAGGAGARGWGIPMATDIAFALGVLALLGSRVPVGLKVFVTASAIADDIGAILVIAAFYSPSIAWGWLLAALLLLGVLLMFGRMGVDSVWPYALIGALVWAAVARSGVHATIAGVLVAFTIPATARLAPLEFTRRTRERIDGIELDHVEGEHALASDTRPRASSQIRRDARHTLAPLQRMESALHPVTTFLVLPLFALGNAGVQLTGAGVQGVASPISIGIALGLLLGKPLGILGMTLLAVRLRIASLPAGVRWGHVVGAGILGGVGFTMSIFMANLAFQDPAQIETAKSAILLASALAGTIGYVVLRSQPVSASQED